MRGSLAQILDKGEKLGEDEEGYDTHRHFDDFSPSRFGLGETYVSPHPWRTRPSLARTKGALRILSVENLVVL